MSEHYLHTFLSLALRDIMSVIHADCGSLFLFDAQNQELVLNSFYNSGSLHLNGMRQRMGEGISGKVANLMKAVLVKDIDHDSRFSRNGFGHYRTKSFISLPIFDQKGILLGLINLADKATNEPFSEDDFQAALTIVKYLCVSLENLKNCTSLEKYASVGKLAAGVVHEINNPLDGIIRFSNILLNQMDENSVGREYLLEVKKGLQRIANITRSLLTFSHQVNANTSPLKQYTDIHLLIEESLNSFAENSLTGIQIKKNFSKTTPKVRDLG